jgi:branched-chain amino acid transport system substrate-binding protein
MNINLKRRKPTVRKMNLNIGGKPFCGLIALGVIFVLLGTASGEAQTPKVVKIGGVFPLTGPMAVHGEAWKNAVEIAVGYINETGGIKNLGGAKLEAVFGDNQMKPAVAATEAERLIETEKVVAVFGAPPSATSLAGSAVAERLKTPFLDPTSFADQLCRRGFKYFFEMQPTAANMVDTQVKFLNFFNKNYQMNIKRVGLIHEDTDYGKSLSRAQRELVSKNGYELVADVEHNAKAPDLSSPMLKLKSADPQFVFESAYFADALQIAKISARLGFRVPHIEAETRGDYQWIKAAGPTAEGSFCLIQWDRDNPHPLSKELTKRYEEKYKKKANSLVGATFQLVFVLKRAIEAAGSVDREQIKDALHKIEILPGPDLIIPYEKIKFDETGMNTFGRPLVAQIQDGELVLVWPEQFATQKARILEGWKKP